jgi:hypothetical protein
MKGIIVSGLLTLLLACNSQPGKKAPVKDTTTLVYPTDSNVPLDTDDHNKPNMLDTIPLDAPPITRPGDTLRKY